MPSWIVGPILRFVLTNSCGSWIYIEGEKTRLTLTTLGKHNYITECVFFSLEVFDLAENNLVELPTVFSVPVLPVSKDSIPRQDQRHSNSFDRLRDWLAGRIRRSLSLEAPRGATESRPRPLRDQVCIRVDSEWSSGEDRRSANIMRTLCWPTNNLLSNFVCSAIGSSVTQSMTIGQQCQRRTLVR